jgi:hypothetical protein
VLAEISLEGAEHREMVQPEDQFSSAVHREPAFYTGRSSVRLASMSLRAQSNTIEIREGVGVLRLRTRIGLRVLRLIS